MQTFSQLAVLCRRICRVDGFDKHDKAREAYKRCERCFVGFPLGVEGLLRRGGPMDKAAAKRAHRLGSRVAHHEHSPVSVHTYSLGWDGCTNLGLQGIPEDQRKSVLAGRLVPC